MKFTKREKIIEAALLVQTHNRYALEQMAYFNINLLVFHEERARLGETHQERTIARHNISFDLAQIRHCYMAMNRLDEGQGKHAEEEPNEVPIHFRSENFYAYINGIRASKGFPSVQRIEETQQPPSPPNKKCTLN